MPIISLIQLILITNNKVRVINLNIRKIIQSNYSQKHIIKTDNRILIILTIYQIKILLINKSKPMLKILNLLFDSIWFLIFFILFRLIYFIFNLFGFHLLNLFIFLLFIIYFYLDNYLIFIYLFYNSMKYLSFALLISAFFITDSNAFTI